MFCYQENTHFSQAVGCSREKFWEQIRKPSTRWGIESRREILAAVNRHDEAAISKWLKNSDYLKFLTKKENLKERARKAFFAKSDEERLLAFAQNLKDNLPAFIFSCREFDETPTDKGKPFRHRWLKDCHVNGLVMLDIDHVEDPMEVFEAWKANEELKQRTALVHITSSKQGLRFVFTADKADGNLADNQIVFAEKLGYKADRSCIDATRNSFAPKEEDILFINEEKLFDYEDKEFERVFGPLYRKKETQPLYHKFDDPDGSVGSGAAQTAAVAGKKAELRSESGRDVADETVDLKWRGYDVQSIIDARFSDKLPCAADSNRHKESLKLASDLLVLFDGDRKATLQALQAQPWVQEIIDERDENVEQTVESAAQHLAEREKGSLNPYPSKPMQEAIKKSTGKTYQEITKAETPKVTIDGTTQRAAMEAQLEMWGEQIEALFPHYPILRDVCKGLKRNQYPAALFVAGGLMMTLMTRCTYRFYHRPEELRRLNNCTLIIGDPASGKSFATRLFKLLAAPIVKADKVGKDAINAYREQIRSKGANKDKPQKPKVVVRLHPARTSNAQFIQDMVNSVEVVDGEVMQLHMLTFDTELDNTVTVQKGGSWIDKQSLELKAFHNEEDGQAYSNNESILQDFYVTWNFIYTGTPIALKKKVNSQNFGSGLATRLSCIPLPSTNFRMMDRETTIDYESDERLKDWAFKLDRTKGELSVQKLVDELYDWTARRMEDAGENESFADEMLLKRCAYHGLNFSAPFVVMRHWAELHQEGDFWCGQFQTDETDWELAELITNIQLTCQRYFFGAMAEQYFDDKDREASYKVQRRSKTIEGFKNLPEEFTVEDVMRCFGVNSSTARTKITRFQKDGLVGGSEELIANGTHKSLYKKTGRCIL